MNYVIFRKFLENKDCNSLLANLEHIPSNPMDLGLIDGEKSDTWHESKRNPGMSYFYSTLDVINFMMCNIKVELTRCTGVLFDDTLSSKATTFCKYANNAFSGSHRDRDKTSDKEFQKYTAIILLSSGKKYEGHVGFNDEFFINMGVLKYSLSLEGKRVEDEQVEDRFYPNLRKGDLILFRNDISIHGVDPVFSDDGIGRITTAFRSK